MNAPYPVTVYPPQDQGQLRAVQMKFDYRIPLGRSGRACAITYLPWMTLDDIRPQLEIPSYNTGRLYTDNGQACGIVFSDVEGLHAQTDDSGKIVLATGIELPLHVYRGQTEEYAHCTPSIARFSRDEDRLLAYCRNAAFEDALAEHPYIRLCEQSRFLDRPLSVDVQGLAQHYGLPTDLLDLTSNFDVATFFATCYWDAKAQGHRPVKSANRPGVLFRCRPYLSDSPAAQTYLSRPIGWQPLRRPEQQRALAARMSKGDDFSTMQSVQRVRFRHSARRAFDEGRALFPPDAAAELAFVSSNLMTFTRAQIDRAWNRLNRWNGVPMPVPARTLVEQGAGLAEVALPVLSWEGLGVEQDETKLRSQLETVLGRVRYRMASYL